MFRQNIFGNHNNNSNYNNGSHNTGNCNNGSHNTGNYDGSQTDEQRWPYV